MRGGKATHSGGGVPGFHPKLLHGNRFQEPQAPFGGYELDEADDSMRLPSLELS
jgi:hypothetical protein